MTASRSWMRALAGDAEVAERLSDAAQVADMLRIEALYAQAAGKAGKLPSDLGDAAAKAIKSVKVDHDRLMRAAAKDGVPVPDLVLQIKEQVPVNLREAIHKGLTSQDVTDTAFVLAAKDILESFETHIETVMVACDDLNTRFGANDLMGRTRMQAALPIKVAHRIAQWRAPFEGHLERLSELRPRLLNIQLAGPVGNGESFDGFAAEIARQMAQELDLAVPQSPWHTRRDGMAELANWLAMITGSLGKIGADLALMAQQGVDEATLKGGGTSSAMAHKSNPVGAEILLALARDTALQQTGMTMAMGHEQERSGSAWTLEWLVMPRMLENTGAALKTTKRLLGDVISLGQPSGIAKL
ncbi:3-carboxy-cis,cis-muconate cycloisomerase [Roseovarius rhodophyticola]|uniref:3-carboxy-cis,cis-muconate cycloisomerase n=1 Tax=Roseovarius rhodophyticola TaxID=3080827 RepID=A0ABZ2TFY2_9RHOB|nr:3-carboxy-cis,cis-muconate cycloisomerase [Roseovarius sp. W115]MDV2928841.1 3-carboxy-cis,cis-muconate cycloisomerase [Roseovarius sp. W115]